MTDFIIHPVGMLEVNCMLVPIGDKLYIIDPGADAQEIINLARKQHFSEAVILLTHAHVDHIGAVGEVAQALNVKTVYLHSGDHNLYSSPSNCLSPWLPRAENLPPVTGTIDSEDFSVLETPGHTQGGVCFYFKQIPALFVGDTLFAGSVGRTDLPGGNHAQLIRSIKEQLFVLPPELKIYPGHGVPSSIGREKSVNPYL